MDWMILQCVDLYSPTNVYSQQTIRWLGRDKLLVASRFQVQIIESIEITGKLQWKSATLPIANKSSKFLPLSVSVSYQFVTGTLFAVDTEILAVEAVQEGEMITLAVATREVRGAYPPNHSR